MRKGYPYRQRKTLEPQPKEEGRALKSILANAAIILTILTAMLYFHGRSLTEGYLSYWGLGTDLFPITTEDALYFGAYTYVLLGLENWKYFLLPLLYALGIYALLFLLCFNKPFSAVQRMIQSKKVDLLNDRQKVVLGDFSSGVEKVLRVLLVILCFLGVTASASVRGRHVAEKAYAQVLAGTQDAKPFDVTSVVFRDEQDRVARLSGYQIASSTELYAICTKDGVQVIPFSRIVSIQMSTTKSKIQNTEPQH